MGRVTRKPVLGVSDNLNFKPVSSATETSQKSEIAIEASLGMIVSNTRITKTLIRLRRCAGWSAPLLFANHRRQVFLRRGPNTTGFKFGPPSDKTFGNPAHGSGS